MSAPRWSGANMRCPTCNKYMPDRCICPKAADMQPAPATEQASGEEIDRQKARAWGKARYGSSDILSKAECDAAMHAAAEGYFAALRATQAERVQSSESIDGPEFEAKVETVLNGEAKLCHLAAFVDAWGARQRQEGRRDQHETHVVLLAENLKLRDALDARPATASTDQIEAICDAYESGVGHGLQRDGHKSGSMFSDPENGKAYEIGYSEGESRATASKAEAAPGVALLPIEEWNEDYGDCLFFYFENFEEAPEVYCSSPLVHGFDEFYWTHFVRVDLNSIIEQAIAANTKQGTP